MKVKKVQPSDDPSLRENLVWGLRYGLRYAVFFSVLAFAAFLIAGPRSFAEAGTTLGLTLITYFAGGVAAGAMVGICRPLLHSWLAAALIGVLAAIPVCVMLKYVVAPGPWSRADVVVVGGLSLFYGLVLGPLTYRTFARRAARSQKPAR